MASDWELELGEPYLPGGQCAWVALARGPTGEELALKVGWRHPEAEHEAAALRFWDGDGAVRCFRESVQDRISMAVYREGSRPVASRSSVAGRAAAWNGW